MSEQLRAVQKLAKYLKDNGYEFELDYSHEGEDAFIEVRIPREIELPDYEEEPLEREED